MGRFQIFAATTEDLNQGWVWIGSSAVADRQVVRIHNPTTGKKVYCEALAIDENFIRGYNQPPRISIKDWQTETALVISGWYRDRLGGLATKSDADLNINPVKGWYSQLRAALDHPQIVVRIATILALCSILFSIIGIIFSIKSLCR